MSPPTGNVDAFILYAPDSSALTAGALAFAKTRKLECKQFIQGLQSQLREWSKPVTQPPDDDDMLYQETDPTSECLKLCFCICSEEGKVVDAFVDHFATTLKVLCPPGSAARHLWDSAQLVAFVSGGL